MAKVFAQKKHQTPANTLKKKMLFSIPWGSMRHQHWRQQLPSHPTSFGIHLPGAVRQRVAKVQLGWHLLFQRQGEQRQCCSQKIGFQKSNDGRRVGLVDANNPNLIADFNCDMFCQEIRSKTIPQAI